MKWTESNLLYDTYLKHLMKNHHDMTRKPMNLQIPWTKPPPLLLLLPPPLLLLTTTTTTTTTTAATTTTTTTTTTTNNSNSNSNNNNNNDDDNDNNKHKHKHKTAEDQNTCFGFPPPVTAASLPLVPWVIKENGCGGDFHKVCSKFLEMSRGLGVLGLHSVRWIWWGSWCVLYEYCIHGSHMYGKGSRGSLSYRICMIWSPCFPKVSMIANKKAQWSNKK